MKTQHQSSEPMQHLADKLKDHRVAMLTLPEEGRGLSSRPMTPLEMDEEGCIWIMGSRKTLQPLFDGPMVASTGAQTGTRTETQTGAQMGVRTDLQTDLQTRAGTAVQSPVPARASIASGTLPANLAFVDTGSSDYVSIAGHAELVEDMSRKQALWTPVGRPWFSGPDDPDLTLIRITPLQAEIWDGPDNSAVRALALVASIAAGREIGLGHKETIEPPNVR